MGIVVKCECDLCGKEIKPGEEGLSIQGHEPRIRLNETEETLVLAKSYIVHLECARRVVQMIGKKRERKVHDPLTAVNPVLIYDPETGTASKSPFD